MFLPLCLYTSYFLLVECPQYWSSHLWGSVLRKLFFFKSRKKIKDTKMKAFHPFLCICSTHIHAFLFYQTSLTKHMIKDKNKNTKLVIAESAKLRRGAEEWGGHAPKSSMSSSLWDSLSHLPSEDKSKAASAGQIVKCACQGPSALLHCKDEQSGFLLHLAAVSENIFYLLLVL